MSVDLQMLIASATLCVLLALPYTMGFIFTRGLFTVVGNREDFPASHGWMGRSHRAHLNMVENLVPFAALILAAQASGQADAWTALGAQVFFYSRVVHAVVYTIGVPWLRTLAWFGGVIGMAMVLFALVS
ncbi:MAPEG family protein [Ferrovibrio xuzhouensis]|uniref:MAPEG family protein n=1 Tax=Ferrovibrio xuzhouensis TaxID=1576914 RepID=A0ABV7VEM6_9PROT